MTRLIIWFLAIALGAIVAMNPSEAEQLFLTWVSAANNSIARGVGWFWFSGIVIAAILTLVAALGVIQLRKNPPNNDDKDIQRMAEAYANAWAADIKTYLGQDVPSWDKMGPGMREAMIRVSTEVFHTMRRPS